MGKMRKADLLLEELKLKDINCYNFVNLLLARRGQACQKLEVAPDSNIRVIEEAVLFYIEVAGKPKNEREQKIREYIGFSEPENHRTHYDVYDSDIELIRGLGTKDGQRRR